MRRAAQRQVPQPVLGGLQHARLHLCPSPARLASKRRRQRGWTQQPQCKLQPASAVNTPLQGGSDEAQAVALTPEVDRARRRRLWYLAVKPPMYSVCIVPVLVGAAAAFYDAGILVAARSMQLLLGSIMIIAWLNLSNDAFDAAVGIDGGKAESVVNLTGNRLAVLWTANAFLAAGGALLWQVVKQVNDPRPGWMLAAAIALGYMYQGPPFRLGYKGLGEPITFVTFGPLATSAFYLMHVADAGQATLVSHSAAAASVVVGLTTATILFCSHFHQLASDKSAGKLSPIVRLGSTHRGLQVLRWAVAVTYVFAYVATASTWLPWTCAVTLPLSIPAAGGLLKFCADKYKVPDQIRPLKVHAIKWHSSVGLALILGFFLHRQLFAAPILA